MSFRIRLLLVLAACCELIWTCWCWTHPPVPVLLFHAVEEGGGPLAFWTLTPRQFREILDRVQRLGFRTIDDQQLIGAFSSFRGYDRLAVLTFDDGLASHRDCVAPELASRNMRGVFFVTRRAGTGRLSEADVQALAKAGHAIGSHSATHGPLLSRPGEPGPGFQSRLVREMAFPRAQLRRLVGHTILSFAYPGGEVSLEAQEMARTSGYRLAFTADYGSPSPWTDRMLLPRNLLFSDATPGAVERYMTEPLFWLRIRAAVDIVAVALLLVYLSMAPPRRSLARNGDS
ncbi:MAG: polysaccharide deacetylase family protein [Candidatus Wallbacteria bacterium]|nr:polysaccharide deacetylase family protein [Candidatus Wallbacteria bacterium]